MPVLINPFHKHNVSEFHNIFIQLIYTECYSSIITAYKDMDKKNLPSASPINDVGNTSDNE